MSRPNILIDWTEVNDKQWLLTAAVPAARRAIPIYHEAHPPSGNGSRWQVRRFVRRLRRRIPEGVRPTLIVDAGFMRPFYEACREYGFDLVVRLQGHGRLRWGDRTTTSSCRRSRPVRFAETTRRLVPRRLASYTAHSP